MLWVIIGLLTPLWVVWVLLWFAWRVALRQKKAEPLASPKPAHSFTAPQPKPLVKQQETGSRTAPRTGSSSPSSRTVSSSSDNTLTNLLLIHAITSHSPPPPPPPLPSYDSPSSSYDSGGSSGAGDFSGDTGSGGSAGGDF